MSRCDPDTISIRKIASHDSCIACMPTICPWSMHTGHRSQSRLLYHCIRLQPGEARCATPAERRWACELLEATARADRCASTGAIAAGVV